MKSAKLQALAIFLSLLLLPGGLAWAQSGTINGTVIDAETGDPLPGVNVTVEETSYGATTDTDGYYSIINVSPGTYTVQASFVGYATQRVEAVDVNIDLVTEVDFELQESTAQLQEVTVQAEEPLVRRDISANVANLKSEDVENLPIASVSELISLQPGIQGMSVRGGGLDELAFQVDGASAFDERSQRPFTGVSYTSIEEVQVQTGGFNAEYGNARSGLINVVTKEGSRNYYTADVILRYSPPSNNTFGGQLANDPNAFWMRPYVDPDVAFVGTDSEESPWDRYTRRQYPQFDGWNTIAERNPELTAEQWQEVFMYRHRKDLEVTAPDYTIDGSVGGPIPGIGPALGNLRFFASYRQTQNAFMIPQIREGHGDRMGRLKLTSDIAQGMKLQVDGMLNKETSINDNLYGNSTGMMNGGGEMVRRLRSVVSFGHQIWSDQAWSLYDVERAMGGITFTHNLGANTYYQARLNRMHTDYLSYKGRERDSTIVESIGGMELTEEPFGFSWEQRVTHCGCLRLGGLYAANEDSSWSDRWSGQFDITSQLNRYLQVKSGLDYGQIDHRRLIRGTSTGSSRQGQDWQQGIAQGAAYSQVKLDFESLVANVGVRVDYLDGLGNWYVYDRYDERFSQAAEQGTDIDDLLDPQPIKAQFHVSPRLGVSFPVTVNSKFFFNYGHFRGRLEPNNMFTIDRVNAINSIGNPHHPMPRTVSYELGYEQNLFNQFLVRLTGYYKDITDQPRYVSFQSATGDVSYGTRLPFDYEDIRGFEATLRRHTGWVRGFANFTYMARKSGDFGWGTYYENPVQQASYEASVRNRQWTPVPQPYARFNLEFIAPRDFGPEVAGIHPLEDWRLSGLGSWSSGSTMTWCGGGGCDPDLQNNLRWRSTWSFDLRLARNFNLGMGDLQFFVDMSNALNIRQLNRSAFTSDYGDDFTHYMRSLQFDRDIFADIDTEPHVYIPGDDRPGDYRDPGVEFRPIEIVSSLDEVSSPAARAFYYETQGDVESGTYYQWADGGWQQADQAEVQEVLDTNAYIDMPNFSTWTFINPRRFQFGIRVTL